MKLFALFLSVSAVSASGSGFGMMDEWKVFKHWTYSKAMESCIGEDNMKQYMVDMKKAVAKCHQKDAPELNLPPYRSTYRFINTMLTNAEQMENDKISYLFNMMKRMEKYSDYESYGHGSSNRYHSGFRPYSNEYDNDNSWMEKMMKKVMMKKMMDKMMGSDDSMTYMKNKYNKFDSMFDDSESNFNEKDMMESMMRYKMKQSGNKARFDMDDSFDTYNPFSNMKDSYREKMAELLSRNKRQAGNKDSASNLPISLDIGDRLVDKLKNQKEQMEEQIGNMTCVLRECGVLNQQNVLDVKTQKNYLNKFNFKSKWLKNRIMNDIETCVDVAKSLPENYMENMQFDGVVNMAQVKTYMKCIKYSKMRSCMYQDVKEKLENNFGKLEQILQQTQMTEEQLFPLVMNLLHGDEMEYSY